jgi:antitoxin (DNA-binding transcriptional repressor) of toxin-antitoxin stability system
VTLLELSQDGSRIVERARAGERIIVTMDGLPAAELGPIARPPLDAEALVRLWRTIPEMDGKRLRADIDTLLDTSL